jgi:hypothetical protein
MESRWDRIYREGTTLRKASREMHCSEGTAKKELRAAALRAAKHHQSNEATSRLIEKKTSMENRAYTGIAEWGERAQVSINDRLPHLVGMNDRATQLRPDANIVCQIPIADNEDLDDDERSMNE